MQLSLIRLTQHKRWRRPKGNSSSETTVAMVLKKSFGFLKVYFTVAHPDFSSLLFLVLLQISSCFPLRHIQVAKGKDRGHLFLLGGLGLALNRSSRRVGFLGVGRGTGTLRLVLSLG